TLPRKILAHAVQLNAAPDALIHEKMERLAHAAKHRGPGILHKPETGSSAVLDVERFNRIIESAGGPHNWHRTILQTIDLVQAAGFVPRRHQEHVRASFDVVRHRIVVSNLNADATGVCGGKGAE